MRLKSNGKLYGAFSQQVNRHTVNIPQNFKCISLIRYRAFNSNNDWPILLPYPPSPHPRSQCVSFFRNDKKVCLNCRAMMPTANWSVSATFILWFCNNKNLLVNIVYLVHTCFGTHLTMLREDAGSSVCL